MRRAGLGCCGNMSKCLLTFINLFFFIAGLVVLIAASVLKWGNTDFWHFEQEPLNDIVEIGKIGNVAHALLIVGSITTVFGFLGLCGARCLSKIFLIFYELVVVVLFLVHFVIIMALLLASAGIELEYRKELNSTVGHINSESGQEFEKYCQGMKAMSTLFHCCGANGPSDFTNSTVALECCHTDATGKVLYEEGCADKTVNLIRKNALNFLVKPSGVILGIELFAIIMVAFLIGRIGSNGYTREI